MTDNEKEPVPQPGIENKHRTIIIVVTIVLVALPLILGALRLMGYL
jgi:hypothetical protein